MKAYSSKTKLPDADYVFEETDDYFKIIKNLTPKLIGQWTILIVNPSIASSIELLREGAPNWLVLEVYLSESKLEKVCLEFPEYQPKKISFREQAKSVVAGLSHLIDKKALNILIEAFRGNMSDFTDTIEKLDKECKTGKITVKDVQSKVNYTKPTYASDVLNAFLTHEANRWSLYNKLVLALGDEYAYNALYKYSKTLLEQKTVYLRNEDVKYPIVKRVDGIFIDYVFSLFSLSSNYKQLYSILYYIDNRSEQGLERIYNAYL